MLSYLVWGLCLLVLLLVFFFFNDTATTEIYTLSLHDALPTSGALAALRHGGASRPSRKRTTCPYVATCCPRCTFICSHPSPTAISSSTCRARRVFSSRCPRSKMDASSLRNLPDWAWLWMLTRCAGTETSDERSLHP